MQLIKIIKVPIFKEMNNPTQTFPLADLFCACLTDKNIWISCSFFGGKIFQSRMLVFGGWRPSLPLNILHLQLNGITANFINC